MSRVTLKNLVKTYPEKHGAGQTVVHGIDLEVREGEFMVLVGPSGCGKSTTLRMIAGLEEVSGGTIEIGDRVVNDVRPKDRDIAMVFQNYALYPHMSVYENLAFCLKLRKFSKAEIEHRVKEAAALLGLESYLDRRPSALSGGQRQRVALGRAIVRQPQAFLFDEPLSNLDAKMRTAMRTELSKLHARLKATMIYVTHDQVEAMTMGDRICALKDGRIMQVASPAELYSRPENLFVAGFIGSPAMNFFRGTIKSERGNVRFVGGGEGAESINIPLSGEVAAVAARAGTNEVVLGLRPEDIHEAGFGSAEATAEVRAGVELVELMGPETLVHLSVGATSFIARMGSSYRAALRQRVAVRFDLSRGLLFNAKTEVRLR